MTTWQWLLTCFACSATTGAIGMMIGGFVRNAKGEMEPGRK